MNYTMCEENTFTFSHLLDRVQFDNVNHIDDILKDQFIFGISNERVREKCTMNLNKINDILRQQLSMELSITRKWLKKVCKTFLICK